MQALSIVLLILAPVLPHCQLNLPLDCSDIYHHDNSQPSGVYTIYPIGATSTVQVYCDMVSEGGRWTVFQRRMDGTVNFYRPWSYYKTGFGTAAGEYWLGLENLFHLTARRSYELLVDMEDFSGNKVFARYASFSIASETDGYRLTLTGFRDSMGGASGNQFSTLDRDQDTWGGQCARSFLGGFWYTNCHSANPNGIYRWGEDGTLYAIGVSWSSWKGYDYSLKTISMKLRPKETTTKTPNSTSTVPL